MRIIHIPKSHKKAIFPIELAKMQPISDFRFYESWPNNYHT